jgi:hypothetical protein
MTKLELEEIANLDIKCEGCNQSNSLMEAARRDTKFKFEFEATQWVCIMKALTSSLNSMKKAGDKSEAVNYVVQTQIWHHERLIKKIKNVVHDKHGYINSSDANSLKNIEQWLIDYN